MTSFNEDDFLYAVENGELDHVKSILTAFPDKLNYRFQVSLMGVFSKLDQ